VIGLETLQGRSLAQRMAQVASVTAVQQWPDGLATPNVQPSSGGCPTPDLQMPDTSYCPLS
jgi:hypothetical protein